MCDEPIEVVSLEDIVGTEDEAYDPWDEVIDRLDAEREEKDDE